MALDIHEAAKRLIKVATGDEYGDGQTVTDIVNGYAPGSHGDTDAVVVLGDWNDRYRTVPGVGSDPVLNELVGADGYGRVLVSNVPSRLASALERIGAEVEWYDNYTQCCGCYKAVQTEPDSYSWVPPYVWGMDGALCSGCATDDVESALEYGEYLNDYGKAVTFCDAAELEAIGFTRWQHTDGADGAGGYAHGWYPGQNDTPRAVYEAIEREFGDAGVDVDIVFLIDHSGQFDIHFGAFYRLRNEDNDDN